MGLWAWALKAYARPGVAAACLALQDRHGQNVPYLLWAAWARTTDPGFLAEAARRTRAWDAAVVSPLREARRKLAAMAAPINDHRRELLRTRVRDDELAAERLIMEALEARIRPRRPACSTLECLRAAAIAWAGEAPDAALRTLAETLDAGLPSTVEALHDRDSGQGSWAHMDDQESELEDDLRARLAVLGQEHSDLDVALQALAAMPMPDMMVIGRLKRKKLTLKDEIKRLQDQLTPDIIA